MVVTDPERSYRVRRQRDLELPGKQSAVLDRVMKWQHGGLIYLWCMGGLMLAPPAIRADAPALRSPAVPVVANQAPSGPPPPPAVRRAMVAGREIPVAALRESIAQRLAPLADGVAALTTPNTLDLRYETMVISHLSTPTAKAGHILARLAWLDTLRRQGDTRYAEQIKLGLLVAGLAHGPLRQPRLAADMCEAYILPWVGSVDLPHYSAGSALTTLESVSHYFVDSRQAEKAAWILEWALAHDPRANGRDGLRLLLYQHYRRQQPDRARAQLDALSEDTRSQMTRELAGYYQALPISVLSPVTVNLAPLDSTTTGPLLLENLYR